MSRFLLDRDLEHKVMQNKAPAPKGRQPSKEESRLASVATRYTFPHPRTDRSKDFSEKLAHDRGFVAPPTD
jgi:hypothetical protein